MLCLEIDDEEWSELYNTNPPFHDYTNLIDLTPYISRYSLSNDGTGCLNLSLSNKKGVLNDIIKKNKWVRFVEKDHAFIDVSDPGKISEFYFVGFISKITKEASSKGLIIDLSCQTINIKFKDNFITGKVDDLAFFNKSAGEILSSLIQEYYPHLISTEFIENSTQVFSVYEIDGKSLQEVIDDLTKACSFIFFVDNAGNLVFNSSLNFVGEIDRCPVIYEELGLNKIEDWKVEAGRITSQSGGIIKFQKYGAGTYADISKTLILNTEHSFSGKFTHCKSDAAIEARYFLYAEKDLFRINMYPDIGSGQYTYFLIYDGGWQLILSEIGEGIDFMYRIEKRGADLYCVLTTERSGTTEYKIIDTSYWTLDESLTYDIVMDTPLSTVGWTEISGIMIGNSVTLAEGEYSDFLMTDKADLYKNQVVIDGQWTTKTRTQPFYGGVSAADPSFNILDYLTSSFSLNLNQIVPNNLSGFIFMFLNLFNADELIDLIIRIKDSVSGKEILSFARNDVIIRPIVEFDWISDLTPSRWKPNYDLDLKDSDGNIYGEKLGIYGDYFDSGYGAVRNMTWSAWSGGGAGVTVDDDLLGCRFLNSDGIKLKKPCISLTNLNTSDRHSSVSEGASGCKKRFLIRYVFYLDTIENPVGNKKLQNFSISTHADMRYEPVASPSDILTVGCRVEIVSGVAKIRPYYSFYFPLVNWKFPLDVDATTGFHIFEAEIADHPVDPNQKKFIIRLDGQEFDTGDVGDYIALFWESMIYIHEGCWEDGTGASDSFKMFYDLVEYYNSDSNPSEERVGMFNAGTLLPEPIDFPDGLLGTTFLQNLLMLGNREGEFFINVYDKELLYSSLSGSMAIIESKKYIDKDENQIYCYFKNKRGNEVLRLMEVLYKGYGAWVQGVYSHFVFVPSSDVIYNLSMEIIRKTTNLGIFVAGSNDYLDVSYIKDGLTTVLSNAANPFIPIPTIKSRVAARDEELILADGERTYNGYDPLIGDSWDAYKSAWYLLDRLRDPRDIELKFLKIKNKMLGSILNVSNTDYGVDDLLTCQFYDLKYDEKGVSSSMKVTEIPPDLFLSLQDSVKRLITTDKRTKKQIVDQLPILTYSLIDNMTDISSRVSPTSPPYWVIDLQGNTIIEETRLMKYGKSATKILLTNVNTVTITKKEIPISFFGTFVSGEFVPKGYMEWWLRTDKDVTFSLTLFKTGTATQIYKFSQTIGVEKIGAEEKWQQFVGIMEIPDNAPIVTDRLDMVIEVSSTSPPATIMIDQISTIISNPDVRNLPRDYSVYKLIPKDV